MAGRRLIVPGGVFAMTVGLALAGCANLGPRDADAPGERSASASADQPSVLPPYKGGGYYKDDGPGANPPPDLHKVPDAVPQAESMLSATARPYVVFGKRYFPDTADKPYEADGLASWYGRKYHGKPTSSGEPYDMYGMSAAHRTLPIPSYVRVTNLENDRSVVVRINDRGPFLGKRIIDLSYTAAYKLDLLKGVGKVRVTRLLPDGEAEPGSFAAGVEDTVESVVTQPLPVAEEIESTPVHASAQKDKSDPIYLQVGAYSKLAGAEQTVDRLVKRLGHLVPSVQRLEAGGLYRVQIGPYADAFEADRASAYIAEEIAVKPIRVVNRKAEALVQPAAPIAQPAASVVQPAAPVIQPAALVVQPAAAARAATGSPAHWVQLAAYANAASADALYARMIGRTDLPGLERIEANGLTKVQAGPYPSAELAETAAMRLAGDLGYKPFKVRR